MTAFQASFRPCLEFHITVLRGRDISKGLVADYIDTPDPYVRLRIPTAPNGKAATTVMSNNKNPEWNESFRFLLDPNKENLMEITLMESDIVSDDVLDTHTFRINDLEIDTPCKQTFKFGKTSKIDVEMKLIHCPSSDSLRFSTELCNEEIEFLTKRRQYVYEAMQDIFGERAPSNLKEVPTIAILGSGGGFRAMTSLSGVLCALKDTRILDCVTYFAGLSGSAWYISCLYAHSEWPSAHPRVVLEELRQNVNENLIWLLLKPKWVYKHMQLISKKKKNGQPISFTDIFGYLIGETIQKGQEDPPKLSHQKEKVADGFAPLPLYTCVNVKKDVSAHVFCEWLEFSPYEAGFSKYGTFMKTEMFGSKFYLGRVLKHFEEPNLHYLQGIWGSAFTILLQQVVREGLKEPEEVLMDAEKKGNVRTQMEDMWISDEIGKKQTGEESDDELLNDDKKERQNEKEKDKEDAPQANGEDEQTEEDKFADIVDKVINKFEIFRTREGRAGLVHNFLRGIDLKPCEHLDSTDNPENKDLVTEDKHIFLVDSGLVLNSPYPILLRPERGVDLYLSFDFSARDKDDEDPFKELLLAEEWAKKNNYPFPPINATEQLEKEGLQECYVFRHPTDMTCPVVIHFVLLNKNFTQYSKPGVPRQTEEEKMAGSFSIFEDPKKPYSTFNFHYPNEAYDKLSQLTEFNTLLCEQTIKDVIAECVQRKKSAAIGKSEKTAKSKKKDKCVIL